MVWGGAAGNIYVPNPEYKDPVMGGTLLNCSFVAGLSCLAWINPTNFIKNNLPDAGANQYKANFYNWNGWWNYNPDIWAPSSDLCHSADANELWPVYYEKAYASCLLNMHANPAIAAYQNAINNEQVSTIPLNRLTPAAWSPFAACPGDFYKFLNDNNYLGAFSRRAGQIYYSRQVTRPIIVGIPGMNGAGHVYSVLGTYDLTTKIADGVGKYIILRNPVGAAAGASPGGQNLNIPSWWVNWSPYLGGAPQAAGVWKEIPLNNGVFGILNDNFNIIPQYTRCLI
jgi:hypothetical protein